MVENDNCTTVAVGKNASASGKVILGHNEDDSRSVVQLHFVPRRTHDAGETIVFGDGPAVIPQVRETLSYVWSEARTTRENVFFGDSYINECGVAIVSNSCEPSKCAPNEKETCGIGSGLRVIVAQRAHTAREGVIIAASLIEKYGYMSSRTYEIADAREVWSLQVPTGHRYVCRRIGDDEIYYMPNWFTIHEVDWSDTEHKNWYFSSDLASFAEQNGWYEPAKPGVFDDFDFAASYQAPDSSESSAFREKGGWTVITGKEPEKLRVFSIKAPKKYSVSDVKALLRTHYEGTRFDTSEGGKFNPHTSEDHRSVCCPTTIESSIVEFGEKSSDTKIWRASETPCVSPYVPYRLCVTGVPQTYQWRDTDEAEATHYAPSADDFRMKPEKYFWLMRSLRYLSDFDYAGTHEEIYASVAALERELDRDLETELENIEIEHENIETERENIETKPENIEAGGIGTSLEQNIFEAASKGFERRTRAAEDWAKEIFIRLGDAKVAENRDRYKRMETKTEG
ncbi:MAG: C69 family dipeptidase [Eubacterium sp.]